MIPAGDAVEVEFDRADGVVDCSRRAALTASAVKDWQRCRSALSRFFTPVFGFDAIARINVLDGLRIYFRNGDIAHIRPSGNAPQLRIYAVSDTQARADQIVELSLREPDGILRQIERAFT